MSKSLNNFFTARDVLKEFDAEAIRFFFLSKHYRSPIDFNKSILQESKQAVKNFYNTIKNSNYLNRNNEDVQFTEDQLQLKEIFTNAMNDDFNTAKAISVLFDISKVYNKSKEISYIYLMIELGNVLGFFSNLEEKLSDDTNGISSQLIELLICYRTSFKKEKNWEMADKIRDDLNGLNIVLKDTPDGTDWSIEK